MKDISPDTNLSSESSEIASRLEDLMGKAWTNYQDKLSSKYGVKEHEIDRIEDGKGPKKTFVFENDREEWESTHYTIESDYLEKPIGFEVTLDESSYIGNMEIDPAEVYIFEMDSDYGKTKFHNMMDCLEPLMDPDFVRSDEGFYAFYFKD